MILSDATLKKIIESGELVIKPIDKDAIQSASIDCRLGRHYLTVEDKEMSLITLDSPIKYREVESDSIIIPPHSFLLATTEEYIELPSDISAFAEGRSSIGRIGLFVQNAGWIDPGFKGKITLELYNANSLPIKLQSGRRICQLVFCRMDRPVEKPYQGKYQGQQKSIGSKIYEDKDIIKT